MRLVKNNVVKIKTDEASIKHLKALGYEEETEDVLPPNAEVIEQTHDEQDSRNDEASEVDGMSYDDLKALATEKGLEFSHNIKKVDLIELIKEA